tara:strand:+ start:182 stop:985 length:804 start_codon:yes stop_codon:yes gene_type:complete
MGFFDRFSRLFRANLNYLISKAEDPAKILDQSLIDMQEDLVKLRKAVAMAIASQKRLKSQDDQARLKISSWYERAQLAVQKGEEDLAREALTRRKSFQDSSNSLTKQLSAQKEQVEKLTNSLIKLESQISKAKTKSELLKARAQAAQAQQKLQNAVGELGSDSSAAAFDRMEEKVEALEASTQATSEIAESKLESQFLAMEGEDDIDDELNALRQSLQGDLETVALPQSDYVSPESRNLQQDLDIQQVHVSEVDAELEELKKNIDNL